MRIFHLRILMDEVQDVFRDIEIREDATYKDLHDAILKAFGFSGNEMASFYASNDDWDRGEEVPLMNMMEDFGHEPAKSMSETKINEMMESKGSKMLYLYDFLRMWIFYVELIDVVKERKEVDYPEVVLLVGNAPAEDSKSEAGPMEFESSEDDALFDPDFDPTKDDSGFEPYDDPTEY